MVTPGSELEAEIRVAVKNIIRNVLTTKYPEYLPEIKDVEKNIFQMFRKLGMIERR